MDNCLRNVELHTKTVEEYKAHIDSIILDILEKAETLVFANVVKKAGITPFIINQYPELRNYILEKMKTHKEIYSINKKIDKAVISLLKSNKAVTFLAIVNRCKIDLDNVYHNEFIKDKIRMEIAKNNQKLNVDIRNN
ncbi:hypothetical protein [Clostridium sp. UBA4548]|uniref:hypothetical protein n=1 Tax=Clostridium sp. UBA4548 TaxID=1946361 RepID=UPI0025C0226D|nr:hypothetical protein [Clostridium sp. UBA4548]